MRSANSMILACLFGTFGAFTSENAYSQDCANGTPVRCSTGDLSVDVCTLMHLGGGEFIWHCDPFDALDPSVSPEDRRGAAQVFAIYRPDLNRYEFFGEIAYKGVGREAKAPEAWCENVCQYNLGTPTGTCIDDETGLEGPCIQDFCCVANLDQPPLSEISPSSRRLRIEVDFDNPSTTCSVVRTEFTTQTYTVTPRLVEPGSLDRLRAINYCEADQDTYRLETAYNTTSLPKDECCRDNYCQDRCNYVGSGTKPSCSGLQPLLSELRFDVQGSQGVDEVYGMTDYGELANVIRESIALHGGEDYAQTSWGDDIVSVGDGDDCVASESGQDLIDGGNEVDQLFGGPDEDTIRGGGGHDILVGQSGSDPLLDGQGGDDRIYGDERFVSSYPPGTYDDTIAGGSGYDEIYGGPGLDFISTNQDCAYVEGGDGNDTIEGEDCGDYIKGGAGDDAIDSFGGNDEIYGDDDADDIWAGPGNDLVFGGNGSDYIDAGEDDDIVWGGQGSSSPVDGNDDIFLGQGVDIAFGQGGDDAIFAGDPTSKVESGSFNILDGGSGNDALVGSSAPDILVGGFGRDNISGYDGTDFICGDVSLSEPTPRPFLLTAQDYMLGCSALVCSAASSEDDVLCGGNDEDAIVGADGSDDIWGPNESCLGSLDELDLTGPGSPGLIGDYPLQETNFQPNGCSACSPITEKQTGACTTSLSQAPAICSYSWEPQAP